MNIKNSQCGNRNSLIKCSTGANIFILSHEIKKELLCLHKVITTNGSHWPYVFYWAISASIAFTRARFGQASFGFAPGACVV